MDGEPSIELVCDDDEDDDLLQAGDSLLSESSTDLKYQSRGIISGIVSTGCLKV